MESNLSSTENQNNNNNINKNEKSPSSSPEIIEEKIDNESPNQKQKSPSQNTSQKPWEKYPKQTTYPKGTELFIGNLNIDITEETLYDNFKSFGEIIDVRIHKNPTTKKCYGFIRYTTRESTNKALELNLSNLQGRQIKVTKSNENSTIFIGNIRKTWNKEDVETKVRRIFHNVSKIEFFPDQKIPHKNRGFCFAVFNNRNEAIKALNYVNNKGGINIDGIPLTCDWADVIEEDDTNSKQIFLSGLKEEVSEKDLKNYFGKYGDVIKISMTKEHQNNNKRKDLAFITYESHEMALNANNKFKEEKNNVDDEMRKVFKLDEGENLNSVNVSLAFSQQAMQTKKKIKDGRKKINQFKNNNNNNVNNNNNKNIKLIENNNNNNNIENILQNLQNQSLLNMNSNDNKNNNNNNNKFNQQKFKLLIIII